ncbi:hypothetical protein JCM5350_003063 [Sporobolomyces pararoseus]
MSFLKPSRLKASFKGKEKDTSEGTLDRGNSTLGSQKGFKPETDETRNYQEIIRTTSKRNRRREDGQNGTVDSSSLRRELLTPLSISPGLRNPPTMSNYDQQRLHPHAYDYSNASTSSSSLRPPYPPLSLPISPPSHYHSRQQQQASTAASTSSRAQNGNGSSSTSPTSPTSPTTPASAGTKAAHYYPYTASSRHGPGTKRTDETSAPIASPGSFKSRGSEAVKERAQEKDLDEEQKKEAGISRQASLPPGAQAPRPPATVRSHPSYSNLAPPVPSPSRSQGRPPLASPPLAPQPIAYPYHQPPATSRDHYRPPSAYSQPPPQSYPSAGQISAYPTPPSSSFGPSPSSHATRRHPGYPQSHLPMSPPPSSHRSPPSTFIPPNGNQSYSSHVRPPPRAPSHASNSYTSLNRSQHGAPSIAPSSSSAAYYNPYGSSSAANAVARNIEKERVAAVARDRERERERERQRQNSGSGKAGADKKVEIDKAKEKENAEGKLSVGIDFGTTFSGIAYGSSRLFAGQIRQILSWPGSPETYRKVPTCILYEQHNPGQEAKIVSWGIEAKNATVTKGLIKCEWFKLLLSPESLRSGVPDPWLPPLPVGKNVVDVIADFLRCIWRYAKRTVTEEIGSVVDLNAADVLLTVPSGWDAAACSLMREAAIRAGLVQSSRGGDVNWRDRLQIITEPEAGAIHASTLSTLHHLRPSMSFLLCDAGGGTVDTAVYKLMGQLSELEIAEMCVRSGSNTGSLFVDLKFEELLRRILKDHPVHLDAASMATFLHSFSETDKIAYHGTVEDDEAIFRFNCFNVEDSHDPSVGLEFGELAIPGRVLKTEVFDPVIEQVLELLSAQIAKIGQTPLDAIILVGGFAASEYLYTRVRQEFGAVVPVIVRPQDCDTATLRGAARYGLGLRMGRGAVSSVISPRSYCMKSKLPAEEEDHWRRPEFITVNDGGTVVCENRLSYLIAKGAVLRKGERLRSRFCKFIRDPRDSIFTAHLFVSDSEELYRYTDEGDMKELCRWTVDLAALPRFHRIAHEGGGYVEFDLGLMLDSAEVRGVLMTEDGIECGAATFEFLGA